MSLSYSIGLILCGLLVSALLVRRFMQPASRFHVLDHPNERSLHSQAVPRTGGVGVLAGVLLPGLVMALSSGFSAQVYWIAAGTLFLGAVSFAEDRFGVKRRYRMVAHVLAAGLLLGGGLALESFVLAGRQWVLAAPLAVSLTLLFVVWMTNLYNFMDGMDGFAGGMAVSGFSAFAAMGWQAGDAEFFVCNALIAAAALGFLVWNFPPARIFMGDAGSASLGFLAAACSLWGVSRGIFPFWAALLVFSPFIVDASVTLLRRLWRREKIWRAHRSHYYQRLVQVGWGHRKTVLRAYLLMACCAFSALRGLGMAPHEQLGLLAMWTAVYALIALKVALLERLAGATRE
jgi:UDP-N-acetylmuramyl pentapeptide phosphotransferase/UDP-N-acetylglucosamine-1-phosphate transferase